jgi:hypothetical protein
VGSTIVAFASPGSETVKRLSLVRIPVIVLVLVARVWLYQMDDQYHALTLYSRFYSGLLILFWVTVLTQPASDTSPASVFAVCCGATMQLLMTVYSYFCGVLAKHQRIHLAVMLIVVAARPPWSVLGQPNESCVLLAALVLGELIGFTLDHFLRTHATERMQVEHVQARAERAEGEASKLTEKLRLAKMQNMEQELRHAKANRDADSRLNHLVSVHNPRTPASPICCKCDRYVCAC